MAKKHIHFDAVRVLLVTFQPKQLSDCIYTVLFFGRW
jgi:hypothetical protein